LPHRCPEVTRIGRCVKGSILDHTCSRTPAAYIPHHPQRRQDEHSRTRTRWFRFAPPQALDALFSGYVERGQIAGVSAQVARRGQTAYRAKYGYADIEANKPLAYDTIFRIASMTKPVTSAALMMLLRRRAFSPQYAHLAL
jgi:CubicO group peptidase (beta-lactamase class C family)